jgi:hypothetical protein
LQAAHAIFPHSEHLIEAQEKVLEQQHVLWDYEARIAKLSASAHLTTSAAASEEPPPPLQQQQQQQHQQQQQLKLRELQVLTYADVC